MVLPATVQTGKKTVEDWITATGAGENWELIDGELIPFGGWKDDYAGATAAHSNYIMLMIQLLLRIIPSGIVRTAPVGVILDDANTPEPDVFWIKEDGRCKQGSRYWEGPPDLIVEVLSAGTARIERKQKFDLYEQYGVSKYWMLDPDAKWLEVYTLADANYQRVGLFEAGETFTSPVLGAVIELNAILA